MHPRCQNPAQNFEWADSPAGACSRENESDRQYPGTYPPATPSPRDWSNTVEDFEDRANIDRPWRAQITGNPFLCRSFGVIKGPSIVANHTQKHSRHPGLYLPEVYVEKKRNQGGMEKQNRCKQPSCNHSANQRRPGTAKLVRIDFFFETKCEEIESGHSVHQIINLVQYRQKKKKRGASSVVWGWCCRRSRLSAAISCPHCFIWPKITANATLDYDYLFLSLQKRRGCLAEAYPKHPQAYCCSAWVGSLSGFI